MNNDVSDAELAVDPKNCTIEDLEICYRNVQEAYTVDEDGTFGEHKETYLMEAEPAYYFCDGCGTDWSVTSVQSIKDAWKLAKAHLAELN